MPSPVTYYCPRCGAIHELVREGYLADKTVTPYPLAGWTYADPTDPFDDDANLCDADSYDVDEDRAGEDRTDESHAENDEEYDGVRIVCGDPDLLLAGDDLPAGVDAPAEGCGEPFYLSFVRFEGGEEVEPVPDAEYVSIGVGGGPSGPSGPRGPGGSGGPGGPR